MIHFPLWSDGIKWTDCPGNNSNTVKIKDEYENEATAIFFFQGKVSWKKFSLRVKKPPGILLIG